MRFCRHRPIAFLWALGILFVWPVSTHAQTYVGALAEPYVDEMIAGDLTTDGGLVVLYPDDTPASPRIVTVKFDGTGSLLWARQIPRSEDGAVRAVEASLDGGVFLAGRAPAAHRGYDVWIARLDSDGDPLWQSAFGQGREEDALGLHATDDGGVVLVGSTGAAEAGHERMLVLKISGEGDLEWSRRFEGGGDGRALGVRSIENGFYVVGEQGGQGLAMRLDESGRVVWSRASGSLFRALALAPDGDGLAAVSAPNRVVRIAADGARLWQARYEWVDDLAAIGERSTGFLLGGETPFLWVADVSRQGELVWSRSWFLPGPPFTGPVRAVAEGADGHVYLAAAPDPVLLVARLSPLGDPAECFSAGWRPLASPITFEDEPLVEVRVSSHPSHLRPSDARLTLKPMTIEPEWGACHDEPAR